MVKKPIYVFKFDDISGKITRFVVKEYKEVQINANGKMEYVFCSKEINKETSYFAINSNKFDRFVSNKVVSFHDDYERAYAIIEQTLLAKINENQKIIKRQTSLLNKLIREKKDE